MYQFKNQIRLSKIEIKNLSNDWVQHVEIGDYLYFSYCGEVAIKKVVAKTKTGGLKLEDDDLIKVKNNNTDLNQFGYSRNNHNYHPMTEEVRELANLQVKERELKKLFELASRKDINADTIERVEALICMMEELLKTD